MKKFILIILTLGLLFFGTLVYFVVRSLNADSYQQQIVSAVSELTGRKMTVSGKTTFKWLPMPTLVMNGVTLSNHNGSDKSDMITADSLQVQIEWGSLFKSPLEVKNVELIKPHLILERLESNRVNWNFPFFLSNHTDINDNPFLGEIPSSASIKIDRLHIKNGTVSYDNKVTGQTATIQNVNGNLSIASIKGPYQFEGDVLIGTHTYVSSVKSDRLNPDAPTKISATVTEKDSGLNLEFNGEITLQDPKKIISGDTSFSVSKPEVLLTAVNIPVLTPTLQQPAVGSFALDITSFESTLNNLILRFGANDDPSAFALTLTVTHTPKTSLAEASYRGDLAVNDVNYDTFKPYFDKLNWSMLTTEQNVPNIQMNVHIPQLALPTGTIKDINGMVNIAKNRFEINSAKAVLPGNMPIVFRVNNGINKETPYLQAHVKGATTNTEPLFTFLNIKAPEQNQTSASIQKMIKSIEADARITWMPNTLAFELGKMIIDNTSVTGTFGFTTNHKKAAFNLAIDNLNADTYTGWIESKDKIPLSVLPKLIKQRASDAIYLSDADISFNVILDNITWHNLPITKGILSGTVKDGDLTLSNAEFSGAATATLKSSGIVSGIGTPVAAIQNMSFSFSASGLPLFLNRAGLSSSLPLINKANQAKIAGSLTNADNQWKSNIMAQLNDAELKLNGTVTLLEDATRFQDFNFNVAHPNFHKFLTLINADTKPVENLNGALRAQGTINGTVNDLSLTNADITVGIQKITGNASFADNGIKKLVINASSPALEAERILPKLSGLTGTNGTLSKKTFDFSKWDNWDINIALNAGRLSYKALDLNDAKLGFSFKDKVFTLSQFSGIQRGNSNAKFNTSGTLSYVSTPTLKADVEVSDLAVRPDFMIINKFSYGGGKMGIKGSFSTSGSSVADMADNLNGQGMVEFKNGQFIGLDLAKIEPLVKLATRQNMPKENFDTQMKRITNLGKTPVQSATGNFSIAQGVVRFMDMTVQTPSATATPTQISWNIPASVLNIAAPFQINGLNGYPPLMLNIDMNRVQKSYSVDYSDLSDMVAGLVQKDTYAKEQAERQAADALAAQEVAQKAAAFQQTIAQAHQSVQQAQEAVKDSADDNAKALMQNALDALSIVNQLLAKENRTPEQENMILEQARLAVLKSDEAKKAAAEGATNYARTFEKMETSATQMITKMEQMAHSLPHIVIIPRLTTQAKQNIGIIQSAKTHWEKADSTAQTAILAEATAAYQAIETAYANVMRFDTSAVVYTPAVPNTNGVRGTISKK